VRGVGEVDDLDTDLRELRLERVPHLRAEPVVPLKMTSNPTSFQTADLSSAVAT
jgi:hypothetical protein